MDIKRFLICLSAESHTKPIFFSYQFYGSIDLNLDILIKNQLLTNVNYNLKSAIIFFHTFAPVFSEHFTLIIGITEY